MREAIQMNSIIVAINNIHAVIICHAGTPNGKRAIITIGDVNGIIDDQMANAPLGSRNDAIARYIDTIIGNITNMDNCCPSPGLSTPEPTEAKSVA